MLAILFIKMYVHFLVPPPVAESKMQQCNNHFELDLKFTFLLLVVVKKDGSE